MSRHNEQSWVLQDLTARRVVARRCMRPVAFAGRRPRSFWAVTCLRRCPSSDFDSGGTATSDGRVGALGGGQAPAGQGLAVLHGQDGFPGPMAGGGRDPNAPDGIVLVGWAGLNWAPWSWAGPLSRLAAQGLHSVRRRRRQKFSSPRSLRHLPPDLQSPRHTHRHRWRAAFLTPPPPPSSASLFACNVRLPPASHL